MNNKKDIKYWRIRIFYSIYIAYVLYYFNRSSFKFLDIFLVNQGILSKESHGMILFFASISYSISKFVAGFLSDIFNPRLLIFFGLMSSGIINILVSNSESFLALSLLWTVNGIFQGFGWPVIAKFLTNWYPRKNRGSWWGIWSTSHNVGDFLLPLLIMSFSQSWRLGLIIPGFMAIIYSFFLLNRLKVDSQKIIIKEDTVENIDEVICVESKIKFFTIIKEYLIKNSRFWFLIFSSTFIYFIRGAVSPWIVNFITYKGYSNVKAVSAISYFEFGGFFGSLFSGWISDRFFSGNRTKVHLIFNILMILSIYSIYLNIDNIFLIYLSIFSLGLSVYGPQMLLGVSVAESVNRRAVATSTGFLGLWSQLGTSLAHIIVPRLDLEKYLRYIFISAICSFIFFIILFIIEYRDKRIKDERY
jgi:OPA family sugar phosphate sensor protein UhpC-like MFS transporter